MGNRKERGWRWGLLAAICCGGLACVMLLLEPVLGVGDDGTLPKVMAGAGLAYPSQAQGDPAYFQRLYVRETESGTGYHSFQTILIWVAKLLNRMATGEASFDIRFLGGIYLLLFLPGICILVKAAADRSRTASQKLISVLLAALMFADVGYMTYFNSFYPEALIFICLIYMAGAAMNLQQGSEYSMMWLMLFAASGALLCFVRRYCLLAGALGGCFCLAQLRWEKRFRRKAGVLLLAGMMMAASFGSYFLMERDFNQADRMHAMTKGVLLGAEDPEEALSEFGIDPSYSLMKDASAYDAFPLTTGDDEALEKGFYDHYTPGDIALYYVRHPAKMAGMVDSAVRVNLEVRREACGNYESSAGRPAGEKSTFWSVYSIFKNRIAPKTAGYLAVLVIVSLLLTASGLSSKGEEARKNTVYMECVVLFALMAVLQTCLVIVESGTAALVQYNGQLGMVMDILLFFTLNEAAGRLKVL